MAAVFILEKHIRRQFFEYIYKAKLANFQLPSFRRSAVTNENSLGGQNLPPPTPGKVGLKVRSLKRIDCRCSNVGLRPLYWIL